MVKVVKVDIDGVYVEDVEYDQDIHNVAKIYENGEISDHFPLENDEGKVVGYLIDIPMKDKFYKPKFEIETYIYMRKHYDSALSRARQNFEDQLEAYKIGYQNDLKEWEATTPEKK